MPVSNEEQLVKQAQEGDSQALSRLYEDNFARVYRYVYVRLGNTAEAEDVTQQVFLKVIDSIRSYKWKGAPFIAWLLRIAHNQVIDYYRRNSKVKTVSIEDAEHEPAMEAHAEDPSEIAETQIEIQRMTKALEKLPPAQREVVALRFTAGLSIAESAQVLGKSEGTIKALQFNAVASLRRILYGDRNATEEA